MKLTYYKILWHTASDWYYEYAFETKEKAKEIAELLQDYLLADSYDIESYSLDLVQDDYEEFKNEIINFLKKKNL